MTKELVKKIIEWWIIFIYTILIYFDFIIIERLKIFFIIVFIVWSYLLIFNWLRFLVYLRTKYN